MQNVTECFQWTITAVFPGGLGRTAGEQGSSCGMRGEGQEANGVHATLPLASTFGDFMLPLTLKETTLPLRTQCISLLVAVFSLLSRNSFVYCEKY